MAAFRGLSAPTGSCGGVQVLETRSSLERLRAVQAELERTDSAESCQMM